MQKKLDLKNLEKLRPPNDLEDLFSQFDEALHACEDKIMQLKKSMDEIQLHKNPEGDGEEIETVDPKAETSTGD